MTTAATEVVWPRPQPGLWWLMPDAPLLPRVGHAMVWAGDAVFVWGGFDVVGLPLTDGGLFDPASGTSERLPPLDVGDTTASYVAWSGADVYVVSATATYLFDPTREAWNAFPPPPVPDGHILTGQLVGTGDGIIVLSRSGRDAEAPRPAIPVRTRRPRPAMFRFERADREWRRLPDPPARFADADRVVVQRGRRPDGRRPRSGWSCVAVVPAGARSLSRRGSARSRSCACWARWRATVPCSWAWACRASAATRPSTTAGDGVGRTRHRCRPRRTSTGCGSARG